MDESPHIRLGRPGTGGRLRRTTPFTGTTATEDLIRDLGQPTNEPHGRSQLMIWPVSPTGDGVIFSRLSGPEIHGGETALGQVHPLRDLATSHGLTPRLIIVALHTSGTSRFENRPDFQVIRDGIELGWLRWVSYRGPDRLSRDVLSAELLYDLLRVNNVKLYLGALGRSVDWDHDYVYLRSLGLASATEAASIKARTQSAIRSRYVDMRRGWPGQRKFGFRRNPYTKYLEVDPQQWEFVKRIHFGYAEAGNEKPTSLKTIAANLATLGCDISYSQVRRCLTDRMYVDGRFFSTVDGERVEQAPITITDPIPEAVFQRNQELLKLRVCHRTTTQIGEYCLNGIPIVHEQCSDLRNSRGYSSHLRGRTITGVRAYRHSPWIPAGCRGFSIPQDTLETAVIAQLRDNFESEPLQTGLAASHRRETRGFETNLITPESRRHISRQIRERAQLKAQLTRRYLSSVDPINTPSPQAYWELVGALTAEIEHLERRLQTAETDPTVSSTAGTKSLSEETRRLIPLTIPLLGEHRILRAALLSMLIREIRVDVAGSTMNISVVLHLPA